MMAPDLPFIQGGARGGHLLGSKGGAGRLGGVTGNLFDGLVQYRLTVGEGVEGADNPDDRVRVAGRLSASLLELEKGRFDKRTSLGEKKVLSIGAGIDRRAGLTSNGAPDRSNLS